MPIPELELKRVERTLKEYCDEKVPEHVRDKLRIAFRVKGNQITLYETRPMPEFMMKYAKNPGEPSETEVAKFDYMPRKVSWCLKWSDRNLKWHKYDGLEDVARFEDLLEEVDRDPTGIFWG